MVDPRFEEWFAAIEAGDGTIPVPQSIADGEAWTEHIGRRQIALAAWEEATRAAELDAQHPPRVTQEMQQSLADGFALCDAIDKRIQERKEKYGLPADGGQRGAIAIALWHRFAPESHMEWEDEREQDIYLDAADQMLQLTAANVPSGTETMDVLPPWPPLPPEWTTASVRYDEDGETLTAKVWREKDLHAFGRACADLTLRLAANVPSGLPRVDPAFNYGCRVDPEFLRKVTHKMEYPCSMEASEEIRLRAYGEQCRLAAWRVVDDATQASIDTILNRLQGWGKAYPLDMFSEPTDEEREWLHRERCGLMDRIAASMGRHMAKCIAEDVAALTAALSGLEG